MLDNAKGYLKVKKVINYNHTQKKACIIQYILLADTDNSNRYW